LRKGLGTRGNHTSDLGVEGCTGGVNRRAELLNEGKTAEGEKKNLTERKESFLQLKGDLEKGKKEVTTSLATGSQSDQRPTLTRGGKKTSTQRGRSS